MRNFGLATCFPVFLAYLVSASANAAVIVSSDTLILLEDPPGTFTPRSNNSSTGPTGSFAYSTDGDTSTGVTDSESTSGANSSGQMGISAKFFGFSGDSKQVSASASYQETFSAPGGNATFDFFIPEAIIGFESSSRVTGLSGGFSVDVSLNGASIFSTSADLSLVSIGITSEPVESDLSLIQAGEILSTTYATDLAPDFSGLPGAGYRFGSFTGSLDLSPYLASGTNLLLYSMNVYVDGPIAETSAIASIGDPLNLSQQPGITLALDGGVPPVPLPPAAWLFGTALVGLIGFGMRRKVA